MRLRNRWIATLIMTGIGVSGAAHAGIQNLHHYLDPGEWSIGLEPEVSFTRGAQSAVSAKFTTGLNDMMNFQAQVGAGTPERRFQIGSALTLDLFPDLPHQPGIGVAAQGVFLNGIQGSAGEFKLLPYLHKRIDTKKSSVDPFVALPLGMRVSGRGAEFLFGVTVGALFEVSHSLMVSTELGIAAKNVDSYFALGMVYLHE